VTKSGADNSRLQVGRLFEYRHDALLDQKRDFGLGLGELLRHFLVYPLRELLAHGTKGHPFVMVGDAVGVTAEFFLGARRWYREQFVTVDTSAAALLAGRWGVLLG
jgi:hypothetical protein